MAIAWRLARQRLELVEMFARGPSQLVLACQPQGVVGELALLLDTPSGTISALSKSVNA